jgi:hypothetical protein
MDDGAPRLSVVVPVGGIKGCRIPCVHVDPLVALHNLDSSLGLQIGLPASTVQISWPNCTISRLQTSLTVRQAAVVVKAPGGLPAFRATIAWDDTETENLMHSFREQSLVGTIAVLGLARDWNAIPRALRFASDGSRGNPG